MVCDFTLLGYTLLGAHLLAGTIFVTGGYFFVRRVFSKPGQVSKISEKSFRIASASENQGHTINRAA